LAIGKQQHRYICSLKYDSHHSRVFCREFADECIVLLKNLVSLRQKTPEKASIRLAGSDRNAL
jgi:hypothetical protein